MAFGFACCFELQAMSVIDVLFYFVIFIIV
jgi:hypothetical protein